MRIEAGANHEDLGFRVKGRIIGDVKIFNARGILKRTVKGKELKAHIDSKLVESAYLGDCYGHAGQSYTEDLDSIGEINVKEFKRSMKRHLSKTLLCKCGRKFISFSRAQVRCGLCKIQKAMIGYRL